MASSDYERATSQDYHDRHPTRYDASGWGAVLSVIALMLILGMLYIGFTSTPQTTTPAQPTAIERTTPAPTTAPAPTPAPPATVPN